MGIFSFFTKWLAVDLGTATTVIIDNNKIVVDEPSIVAYDTRTQKYIAIGHKANQMHGKVHEYIQTKRPIREGVLTDVEAGEYMVREFIKMAIGKSFWSPAVSACVGIPSNTTEVEKRAIRDAAEQGGAREVYLVYQPIAAALGMNLDIQEPKGIMIVDIGGGTTDIAIISRCDIVTDKTIKIAGDEMTNDIVEWIKKNHNFIIGTRTAERIKIEIGAVLPDLQDPPPDIVIYGRDAYSGLPKQRTISYKEVAYAIDNTITKIEEAIYEALAEAPPELAADIYQTGIFLTGGGSFLRGLSERISLRTKIPVYKAENPLYTVALGTYHIIQHRDTFSHLLM